MIEIVKRIARRILREEIEASNKLLHERLENILAKKNQIAELSGQNLDQELWLSNSMNAYKELDGKHKKLLQQTLKPSNVITSGMLLAISVWLKNPNKIYVSDMDAGMKDIEFEDSFGKHLLHGVIVWKDNYAQARITITGYEALNIVIPIVRRKMDNGSGVEITTMVWDVNGAFQVVDEETFWKIVEMASIDMNRILKECTDGDC